MPEGGRACARARLKCVWNEAFTVGERHVTVILEGLTFATGSAKMAAGCGCGAIFRASRQLECEPAASGSSSTGDLRRNPRRHVTAAANQDGTRSLVF